MESSPLFREVRLDISDRKDIEFVFAILSKQITISQVADLKGQDQALFDGDGDVLVLSLGSPASPRHDWYEDRIRFSPQRPIPSPTSTGDRVFAHGLIQAIRQSSAQLELVIRDCNLSEATVLSLAEAIRFNEHLIGVTVVGNAEHSKRSSAALKQAIIETRAPIKYFQDEPLSDTLVEMRAIYKKLDQDKVALPKEVTPASSWSPVPEPAFHSDDDEYDENLQMHRQQIQAKRYNKRANNGGDESGLEEPVTYTERQRWLQHTRDRLRSVTDDEVEIERLVEGLEMYQLEKTIESMLSVQ